MQLVALVGRVGGQHHDTVKPQLLLTVHLASAPTSRPAHARCRGARLGCEQDVRLLVAQHAGLCPPAAANADGVQRA
eukprot:46257-Alexandrium_andersonii.AAC.1